MRILVAVDFSPTTAKMVKWAQRILPTGGQLFLVHVAPPEPYFVGYDMGP
ncbi:universal stress protein, partial [Escherichia coli]